MRTIDDAERRSRLARRHALTAATRVRSATDAARAVVCLHSTEPASLHLSVAARSTGVSVADVERALYDERSLVKQLAMRRTLFAFPRDLLPAAWGSASARVAEAEGRRLAKNVQDAGLAADGTAWLAEARSQVLAVLAGADGVGLPAQAIREAVPMLDVAVATSPGSTWGGPIPVAPRVLSWLGAHADLVRGTNAGHWRVSRPAWTTMLEWLGEPPEPAGEREGYAELVRRWLERFGPGTETDLVWWLGGTRGAVRRALADLDAVGVALDRGATGWVLPGDEEPEPSVEPWAALLPVLDPTVMGWKERDFYLPREHVAALVDRNGNAGSTAWWNGRVVGCWVQDAGGAVRVVLGEDVGADGRAALDAEAERLSGWLDGTVVSSVYKSALMKEHR